MPGTEEPQNSGGVMIPRKKSYFGEIVAETGWYQPHIAQSKVSLDGGKWMNPNQAKTLNSNYSFARAKGVNSMSYDLVGRGFGFALRPGSKVYAVQIQVTGHISGSMVSHSVALTGLSGFRRNIASDVFTSTDSTVTWGTTTDLLWLGRFRPLLANTVNSDLFGVAYRFKANADDICYVDSIAMQLFYTLSL